MRMPLACLATLGLLAAPPMAQAAGAPARRMVHARHQRRGQLHRLSPFDLARRLADLTDEQQQAIAKLQRDRHAEYRKKIAELGTELDQKFAALVIEVLGPEHKDTFQKILAILDERDAAIQAAREEALETLATLRDQARAEPEGRARYLVSYIPRRKQDILRYYVPLTDDQQREFDQARRDSWTALREAMRNIPRPDDWRDAQARHRYTEALRKVREEIDEKLADATLELLNDEQKTAYQTAQKAVDTYNEKVDQAEETCEEKLIELLGQEKYEAVFRPPARPQERPQQEPEKKKDKAATDF